MKLKKNKKMIVFNKIAFSLFVIQILFAGMHVASAECPPDCSTETESTAQQSEINFNDPSQVNNLDPQQLSSAIENGQIADLSIVDSAKLSDAIRDKPSLMQKDSVRVDAERRAESGDVSVLNTNPRMWMSHYGLTADEGAGVESYNKGQVKTRGGDSTTFGIADFPGAKVSSGGKLILPSGAEISSGTVTNQNGNIIVTGGHTALPPNQDGSMTISGGDVVIDGKKYSSTSNRDFIVKSNMGTYSITGGGVKETDNSNGKTLSTFSGTVDFTNDGRNIHGGTRYTDYEDGVKSVSFTPSSDTLFTEEKGSCQDSANCLERDGDSLKVYTKDNNLKINLFDSSLRSVIVDEIDDSSKVTLSRGKNSVTFSDSPFTVQGNILDMKITFTTTQDGTDYKFNTQEWKGKNGNSVSKDQFLTNLKYLLDQGYTIEDVSRAIQERDWGQLSVDKMILADGPAGSNANDPDLVKQLNLLPPYVDVDGTSIKINHAFAGIAAGANAPVTGQIRAWAYTTGGDEIGQVWAEKINAVTGFISSIVSSDKPLAEDLKKLQNNLERAEGYHSPPEQKANIAGRDIVSDIRNGALNEKTLENSGIDYGTQVAALFNNQLSQYETTSLAGCPGNAKQC